MFSFKKNNNKAVYILYPLIYLLFNSFLFAQNILIVVSSETKLYQQTVDSFQNNLVNKNNLNIQQIKYNQFTSKSLKNIDIIVSLGRKASLKVSKSKRTVPTIYALIPKLTLDKIHQCCALSSQEAAIFLDQPLSRQFNLLYTLFGSKLITGILFSDKTFEEIKKIEAAATEANIKLKIVLVNKKKPIGFTIRNELKDSQALLAIPDPLIYNRENIYSIFLTTYSMKIPVIGYSNAMTKAGAVLSLYSSPKDIGKQIADWFNLHDKNKHYREAPHYFHISVNGNVAHSLELNLPKKDFILKKLRVNEPS